MSYLVNKIKKRVKSIFLYDYFFSKKEERKATRIIYAVGDSHTSVFTGLGLKEYQYMQPEWPDEGINTINHFKAYRLGAVTAYNSFNKIGTIKKILDFKSTNFDKKNDILLMCFGEIDVRAHIQKQARLKNITVEQSIDCCVKRYHQTIKAVKNLGCNVAVWGVIASTPLDKISKDIPVIGNCIERNEITRIFNRKIADVCQMFDIPFFSIFEHMIDEKGFTIDNFLMDGFHLSQTAIPIINNILSPIIKFKND